jgi:hypothetical protein
MRECHPDASALESLGFEIHEVPVREGDILVGPMMIDEDCEAS